MAEFCTDAKSWSLLLEAVNRVVECTARGAEVSTLDPACLCMAEEFYIFKWLKEESKRIFCGK